jgi:hypothetical protein
MESYSSLCTLDTIHRLFFVTRLIINKINKVQWVDFKLENVLGCIIFKENKQIILNISASSGSKMFKIRLEMTSQ